MGKPTIATEPCEIIWVEGADHDFLKTLTKHVKQITTPFRISKLALITGYK